MPRMSTVSNPTGLLELDKNRIHIDLKEEGKTPTFSLIRLDLSSLTLPSTVNVVVIGRRGNTEQRIELGSAANLSKAYHALNDLSDEGSWSFRVLLVEPGSPRLVAAAENIRPNGEADSASIIALEPADLGQCPWELQVLDQQGRAVIRFNRRIYPSVGQAEADQFFIGMVLPAAIRELVQWVAHNGVLADKEWEAFKSWLTLHGILDEPDPDNGDLQDEWCSRVVHAFCDQFEFADELRELRAKGAEE